MSAAKPEDYLIYKVTILPFRYDEGAKEESDAFALNLLNVFPSHLLATTTEYGKRL